MPGGLSVVFGAYPVAHRFRFRKRAVCIVPRIVPTGNPDESRGIAMLAHLSPCSAATRVCSSQFLGVAVTC